MGDIVCCMSLDFEILPCTSIGLVVIYIVCRAYFLDLLLLPRLLICMSCKVLFCTYSLADSHVWRIRNEKQLSMLPWCRNCEKEIFLSLLIQSIGNHVAFLFVLLKQAEVEKD